MSAVKFISFLLLVLNLLFLDSWSRSIGYFRHFPSYTAISPFYYSLSALCYLHSTIFGMLGSHFLLRLPLWPMDYFEICCLVAMCSDIFLLFLCYRSWFDSTIIRETTLCDFKGSISYMWLVARWRFESHNGTGFGRLKQISQNLIG